MNTDAAKPDVSIVVVGLNACGFVRECVESIGTASWGSYTHEIIYVDNGSTDDTLAVLADVHPHVKTLANPENRGYCPAANQGARIAAGRYLFFLNDDTIVIDDAIPLLVKFMDQQPDCGVIGSRLFYPDMTEQWSGRSFPTLLNALMGRRSLLARLFPNARPVREYLCKDQLQGENPFPVDWVSAAAMLVRREPFFQVGGLAEDYYYWHEPVFCDRLARIGQKTFLHPLSRIIHHEGQGSGARPYPVIRFHLKNFHRGAYRSYCEHHRLSALDPRRIFVGGALYARMAILIGIARLRSFGTAQTQHQE